MATGPYGRIASGEEFWSDAATIAALRTRDFGRLFRLLSVSAGASQTQLGVAIGLSQGQISEVMNKARKITQFEVVERIADGLGMPDSARAILGLAGASASGFDALGESGFAPGGGVVAYPQTALAAADVLTEWLLADDLGRVGPGDPLFRSKGFTPSSRDWLLEFLSDGTSFSDSEHLTTDHARVIHEAFEIYHELDTMRGGGQAHAALVRFLRTEALPLLERDGVEAVEQDLMFAVSKMAYLAGLTAADSGSCGLAQNYYVIALRLAQEASQEGFCGNVLAAMAQLSLNHGEGAEAVQLTRVGALAAGRDDVEAVAMRLTVVGAHAFAVEGEERASAQAMLDAEVLLDQAQDDLSWTRYLDRAYLLGELANCLFDLREYEQAAQVAEESISASTGRRRRLVLSHASLALSRARMRDRDGAEAALAVALELVDGVQSSRTLHLIREAASAISTLGKGSSPVLGRAGALLAGHSAWRCCPRTAEDATLSAGGLR